MLEVLVNAGLSSSLKRKFRVVEGVVEVWSSELVEVSRGCAGSPGVEDPDGRREGLQGVGGSGSDAQEWNDLTDEVMTRRGVRSTVVSSRRKSGAYTMRKVHSGDGFVQRNCVEVWASFFRVICIVIVVILVVLGGECCDW